MPAFGPRMVCTVCTIGADVRPNWNERAPVCLFGTNALGKDKPAILGPALTPFTLAGRSTLTLSCRLKLGDQASFLVLGE